MPLDPYDSQEVDHLTARFSEGESWQLLGRSVTEEDVLDRSDDGENSKSDSDEDSDPADGEYDNPPSPDPLMTPDGQEDIHCYVCEVWAQKYKGVVGY